jgi:two-component system cell cycle sensor histidine kinase/response regulator CckA
MEPLHVLIVEEGSGDDADLVTRALRRTGRAIVLERVETSASMRAALEGRTWDVVISDWSLPAFGALAALALLEELGLDLPFIVVSGTIGDETGADAMRAGAHDYVRKDGLERLAPAVEREIRMRETRRARREADLARSEAELRFRRLCDSGVTGVLVSDLSDVVIEASDTLLEMVGYTRDDVRAGALNWVEITPPEWRPASVAAKEDLRRSGKAPSFEKEYQRKDGTRVPVLVVVVLLDEARVLTIVTDLTERKRAETALLGLQEQLRQSQKMEAVGRLAGGVAHDFNNLLSVVLTHSQLLIEDLQECDPMRDDLEQIRRAGERAAELTRQLLLFSRHEAIEPVVVDLNVVLSGVDKMLRRVVGEDVELTLLAGASPARVCVDPGSIEQVIMNLVVNARDAMPVGGKLTMETANVILDEKYAEGHLAAKPGSFVMLSVSDTGVGMDKATMERIFDPFFTTKEKGKGTGLGLSTVFGIVQQSAGSVWVHSEVGAGTTFKVYLPQVDAVAEPSMSLPSSLTMRGSETVLLAEDEDQVRLAVRGILRRYGYTVLEARNAGEALLLCERHRGPIDLLLTDVVMPQMSGPELAKRLSQNRPGMKVLCMSGYTDDATVRHGVVEAAFAFLQKPITVETLTKRVRDLLDGVGPSGRS